MLVTISDLHLNDGTVCKQTPQSSSKLFFDNVKVQAEKARIRKDGSIVPLDHIDVVMNGDIFDFIRSDTWFKNNVRPWDAPYLIKPTVEEICNDIIKNNEEFLSVFRDSSENGILLDGDQKPTPVRIFYMVGNHDWFLYGAYVPYNNIRQSVIDAFGLCQIDFPWELNEDFKLYGTCMDHGVYIRHGDKYDEYNYHSFLGRKASSIGDAIALELVTGFPNLVLKLIRTEYGSDEITEEFIKAIEELDNIRPSTMVPVYINNIIKHMTPKKHQKLVKRAFKMCMKNVKNSGIFKEVSKQKFFLTLKLRILQIISNIAPAQLVRIVSKIMSITSNVYQKVAASEKYIREGRCKYVVYGHTHSKDMKGIGKNQIYFNSATWRQIHDEITLADVNGMPYITHNTMTWVTFYKNGERKGREYEIWDGSLDTK